MTISTAIQNMIAIQNNMKVSLAHWKAKITKWLPCWLCKKSDSNSLEEIAKKPLADHFLRGFNMKDCFTLERNVALGAFQFGDFTAQRNDSFHEASINWEDDNNAVNVLLKQKKDGTDDIMFKYGYARLPLNLVKATLKSYIDKDYLDFERKPLINNPYHGNILMNGSIKKQEKTMLQSNLAAIANNDVHIMNL